ncbi:MAG: hypothetical protein RSC06_15840 [Clostridia bacterium]
MLRREGEKEEGLKARLGAEISEGNERRTRDAEAGRAKKNMTKERAVSLLRRYRQEELSPPEHYCLAERTMQEFGYNVYAGYLSGEMIRKIKSAPETENPIETIHHYICWIDEIRVNNGNPITDRFVGNVISVVDSIQQYLGEHREGYNVEF